MVNALSQWLEVEVTQNGHVYAQRFERGKPVDDLHIIADREGHGTLIRFQADPEIFSETTEYEYDVLARRLREQAFLNAGLSITLTDKRGEEPVAEEFCYEGGIREFVKYINTTRGLNPIQDEVIHISTTKDDRSAEVALCYTDSYNETLLSLSLIHI